MVSLQEINICVGELSQADDPPQCPVGEGWADIIQSVKGPNRTKRKDKSPLFVGVKMYIHLLPLDIGAPGPWASELRLELTPSAP